MDVPEAELQTWKRAIETDRWNGRPALDELDNANHERFLAVCRALLSDDSPVIKRVALAKLGQHGDQNDIVAQEGALRALMDDELRSTALFALGRVGTSDVFPLLFSYASAGSYQALRAASQQVRTKEQRDQVINLSRDALFSSDSQLRAAAVDALVQHSIIIAEQNLLLRSAEMFTDDFVFAALEHASDAVLSRLYALSKIYESGAEHKAIAKAISHIVHQNDESHSEE